MTTMDPVKARVKNGRLVLDEPTDLPEGAVIELVPVVATGEEAFDLDEEQIAALRESLEEANRGELVPLDVVLSRR